MGSHLFHPL
ncbi:hypothetical protein MTR67_052729 [Solanum verrucosum]|uniref:Uncharacterized protein n=1 Tax=Solanum verrucosum TaxID=315347 RepID=A0AAF1A3R6_SOLVR|nr:hypothetical protein MTR67_052729 [Solanum verrucosum]